MRKILNLDTPLFNDVTNLDEVLERLNKEIKQLGKRKDSYISCATKLTEAFKESDDFDEVRGLRASIIDGLITISEYDITRLEIMLNRAKDLIKDHTIYNTQQLNVEGENK
ncbi:hypothetical protein GOV13_01605 [Candidatus Pacearchaeota archaeon]|nr:hypothetical protein [Candidatus Pacearchaeota archaeon]